MNSSKNRLRPSSVDGGHNAKLGLVQIRKLSDIRPAPENELLYRAIVNDAEMQDLVKSIHKFGVKTPLAVSADGWLLSGHRRLFACELAGLETVPCIIDASINRKLDPAAFIRSLREHNRQRVKGLDEVAAEVAIDMRGEDAYAHLIKERRLAARIKVKPMDLGAWVKRSELSAASQPMIDAINRVLEELRDYWPVTLRTVH